MSVLRKALCNELVDCIREDPDAGRMLADALAPYLPMPAPHDGRCWMDAKAAATYLGITRNALHKLTGPRAIPFQQDAPGGKCWFHRDDLDAYRRGDGATISLPTRLRAA